MAADDVSPSTPAGTADVRLAAWVQSLFNDRQRTLNDPDTAEAADITLEAVLMVADGMLVQGEIDKDAHAMLRAYLMAMMRIPGVL